MSIGASYPTHDQSAAIADARQRFLESGNRIQTVPVMRRDISVPFMIFPGAEPKPKPEKRKATAYTLARQASAKARAAAEAAEQKTYEGSPCKRGHTTRYAKSSDCIFCKYQPKEKSHAQ